MKGKLYSVGVGPGDPELMTLKAVRLIKECDVLAIPQGDSDVLVAKNIVEGIVDLNNKEQLLVYMPMVKDHDIISKAHQKGDRARAAGQAGGLGIQVEDALRGKILWQGIALHKHDGLPPDGILGGRVGGFRAPAISEGRLRFRLRRRDGDFDFWLLYGLELVAKVHGASSFLA